MFEFFSALGIGGMQILVAILQFRPVLHDLMEENPSINELVISSRQQSKASNVAGYLGNAFLVSLLETLFGIEEIVTFFLRIVMSQIRIGSWRRLGFWRRRRRRCGCRGGGGGASRAGQRIVIFSTVNVVFIVVVVIVVIIVDVDTLRLFIFDFIVDGCGDRVVIIVHIIVVVIVVIIFIVVVVVIIVFHIGRRSFQ